MIKYREYLNIDFEQVLDTIGSYSEEHRKLARREIPKMLAMDGSKFFVAIDNDIVIGVLGYRRNIDPEAKGIYWIEYSYVRPQYQRQGISTHLWDIVENELSELGCRKVYLDIGNEAEHKIALLQYRKRGYIQEGYCPDFWDEGEDCLIYSKRLSKR